MPKRRTDFGVMSVIFSMVMVIRNCNNSPAYKIKTKVVLHELFYNLLTSGAF